MRVWSAYTEDLSYCSLIKTDRLCCEGCYVPFFRSPAERLRSRIALPELADGTRDQWHRIFDRQGAVRHLLKS